MICNQFQDLQALIEEYLNDQDKNTEHQIDVAEDLVRSEINDSIQDALRLIIDNSPDVLLRDRLEAFLRNRTIEKEILEAANCSLVVR